METTKSLREKYNPEGSELRKLQLKMLEILEVTAKICKKHNLPYWISGGTLLGAVRHGGFIPWDDEGLLQIPANQAVGTYHLIAENPTLADGCQTSSKVTVLTGKIVPKASNVSITAGKTG